MPTRRMCCWLGCDARYGRRSARELAPSSYLLVAASDKSVCRHSGRYMGSGWGAASACWKLTAVLKHAGAEPPDASQTPSKP